MSLVFQFDFKKTIQVINFFARKVNLDSTKLKLLKLIFYADKEHLLRFGRTITGDRYYALKHGPVASSTKVILDNKFEDELNDHERAYSESYLKVDGRDIQSINEADEDEFSDSDFEVLNFIYEKYGRMTASQLRNKTHEEKEYNDHWEKRGTSLRVEIPLDDFFSEEGKTSTAYTKAQDLSEAISVFK